MSPPNSAADAAQDGAEMREGLDTLTNIQKAADGTGGAGTGNSSDILDQGEPALAFFDRFSPVYQAVGERFRRMPGGDTSAKFVRDRYDEQRDIDFGVFTADADAMRKAAGTYQDQFRTAAGKLGGLWHGWAGPAAAASQQSFATLNQEASQVGEDLAGAAEVITDTTHTVSKIVIGKATNVLHSVQDRDAIGGMTPDRARDIVDIANGDHDDDKMKRACGYFGVDVGGCGDGYKQQAVAKAGDWVSQVFCPHFEGTFDAVIKICDDTKKAVDEAWKVLTDHLARTPDHPVAPAPNGDQPGGAPPVPPPPRVAAPSPAPAPVGAPPHADPPVNRPLAASAASEPVTGAAAPADSGAHTYAQAAGFSITGGPASADSFAGASGRLSHDGAQPDPALGPDGHAGAVGLGSMRDVGAGGPQGAVGLQSMGDPAAGAQTGANQADAAQAGGAQAPAQDQGGSTMMAPMGGMGMMGGMGAIAAAGRRSNASPWRTQGDLFEDGAETSDVRFRSVLGDAEEKKEGT